jgi:2-phosphosulfolactate phosphatase
MTIDVALNPAEIALLPRRALSETTCVVFDVLRATSSMITALAHGAAEIHPVRTIDEAFALERRLPHALLGGERHGEQIDGFDLGNSPLEYRENVKGRTIITTTTNGTIALHACAHADRVLVGAILNVKSVAEELRRLQAPNVLLVCAGTFETFALEDALAAGLLIRELCDAFPSLSDSAQAALAVATTANDWLAVLKTAQNGRALINKGRLAEVEWCARHSQYKVVGFMQTAVIRPLPQ